MTKVFEREVGASIYAMGLVYAHKCPDHPHAIPDKVDFLGCLPPAGRFLAIEAKETANQREVLASVLKPTQRSCLNQVHACGGIALLLINYDRHRGVGGLLGHCAAFVPPFSTDAFRLEDGYLIQRVRGGWDLQRYLKEVHF